MSSSTDPPKSNAQQDSYTMIPEADLEAIGAHCHYEYCRQLDFLPFRCESCRHTYCLDHRTETSHQCPDAGAWAARRRAAAGGSDSKTTRPAKPTAETGTQCSHPQCKTFIHTHAAVGVHCSTCNREYCLKHRLKEDHDCAKLIPLGARPASAGATQAQKALARLRAWGKSKVAAANAGTSSSTAAGGSSSGAAEAEAAPKSKNPFARKPKPTHPAVALAELKRTAKGEASVPVEKRVYVKVEAEAATEGGAVKVGRFYYSRDWSVGRLLDAAAKALQVENVNNRGGGEGVKLRVYSVEKGRVLEFGEKVGDALKSGETIVLLRGVGSGTPDLIEV